MDLKKKLEESKVTYLDRRETPLPKKRSLIEIVTEDVDGTHTYVCIWKPYRAGKYPYTHTEPAKGYLGTAEVIAGLNKGIGFHAWEQNDSEFVKYHVIYPIKANPE